MLRETTGKEDADVNIEVPEVQIMSGNNGRDGMVLPFRWVESLRELEDADQRWEFVEAMAAYAERGETPAFRGALAALWREFASRIDHDRNKYEKICERNAKNGKNGGRPVQKTTDTEKPSGLSENPEKPKKPEVDGEVDVDIDIDVDIDGDGDVNIRETAGAGSPSVSSPKPESSGNSGTTKVEKLVFDYDGDSRIHGITPEQIGRWREQFPALDVEAELKAASAWLDGNRKNRKTDLRRFLTNWLIRTQDRARPDPGGGPRDFDLGVIPEKRRVWGEHERGMTP